MSIFGEQKPHFTASISIFPCGPTTRSKPARNGIRWGFVYKSEFDELGIDAPHSDVWPDFLDEELRSLESSVELSGTLIANMHIVSSSMVETHLTRLEIGTPFFCMEGPRRVALGKVTSLLLVK